MSFSDCMTSYQGHGVTFEYPDIWELTEEADGSDVVLTVSADDSCFWVLRILTDGQRPADVLESCVSAFREEYEDLEIDELTGQLAGMAAPCRELEFSCHELLNTAGLCCVRTLSMTLLVWWQVTDHELEGIRPYFDRISQSVRIQSPVD